MVAVLPSFFFTQMAADSIASIVFIFFIWISYFQIHTTVALRRLVSLASCVSLKVRYEEIVKAMVSPKGDCIMEICNINLSDIRVNPNNIYEEQNIKELADSIESFGQLENATLYEDLSIDDGKKYTLVGGHRRYLAISYLAERGLYEPVLKASLIEKPNVHQMEQMLIVTDNQQRVKDKETKIREIYYANNYWNYLVSINQQPQGKKREWIAKKTGYGERVIQDILSDIKKQSMTQQSSTVTVTQSSSAITVDNKAETRKALMRAKNAINKALNLSLDDSDILDSDTRAFLDDCMYKLKFIIDDLS